ncbi:Separin [Purpureocillium lavendulum]|uniref:Separin n=1 Tax=Purpureocillium lavendulum TaxID=1247861 RepID=A0AB34FK32_9HYPO|nr:Separin [Purpureocillium lavendulum]
MAETGRAGCVTCSVLSRGLVRVLSDGASDGADDGGGDPPSALPLESRDALLRVDFNAVAAAGRSLGLFVFTLGGQPISVWLAETSSSSSSWLASTFPDVPVGFEVPPNTATDASLAWARQCLSRCRESHSICRRSRRPAPHGHGEARRILDIGTRDADPVRLVDRDTSDVERAEDDYEYVCLSHRWGRAGGVPQTRSSNLSRHYEEIPWSALPRTYRETIHFVRRLGVRLLWIDSLCIVQDDEADWTRESSKMATIFSQALMVVSASKSADADDGLYAPCGQPFKTHYLTHQVAGGGDAETICFRRSLAHMPGYMDQRLGTPPTLPTLTRGWIFQERFLSPRTLHFGPQELFWECLEATICQCMCQNPLEWTSPPRDICAIDHVSQPKTYFSRDYWLTLSHGALERCWHRLVEEYSKLRLTFDKDVFPAISGLAKQFQTVVDAEYLAGLWRKTLVADLLWHVDSFDLGDGVGATGSRPAEWRAPTWSWAAVKGSVKFLDVADGFVPSCNVLDAHCASVGIDSTGQLRDGYLVLRGNVTTRTARHEDRRDDTALKPWQLLRLDLFGSAVNTTWVDYDIRSGPEIVPSGAEVLCLALGESSLSGALYVMVLRAESPAHGGTVAVYKRIGIVQLSRPPTHQGADSSWWLQRLGFSQEVATVKIV